jgi:hypothetical protein
MGHHHVVTVYGRWNATTSQIENNGKRKARWPNNTPDSEIIQNERRSDPSTCGDYARGCDDERQTTRWNTLDSHDCFSQQLVLLSSHNG